MPVTGLMMDLKRMAVHDGPGIRTTLFLKGCSLRCIWCHNPEGISPRPELAYYAHKCIDCGQCVPVCPQKAHIMTETGHCIDRKLCIPCGACVTACLGDALKSYGQSITVKDALLLVMEDRIFYGNTGGVTLSGGEPLLQKEFVLEFLKAAKAEGLHTAVDTCGHVPWSSYETILPYTDIFLYDIKHINPEQHQKLTGHTNKLILQNLQKLSDAGARIEVRMPLVPGCNDDEKTLRGIGEFLGKLSIDKIRVLPYHALARSKYSALDLLDTMPRVASPDETHIQSAVVVLRHYNLSAVSGNS